MPSDSTCFAFKNCGIKNEYFEWKQKSESLLFKSSLLELKNLETTKRYRMPEMKIVQPGQRERSKESKDLYFSNTSEEEEEVRSLDPICRMIFLKLYPF